MNEFRDFSQVRTTELYLQRHGFWKPWYELTDGQFSYGKLSYKQSFRLTSVLETAKASWMVKRTSAWTGALSINTMQDEPTGEFKRKGFSPHFELSLVNGDILQFKRTSAWKGRYAWMTTANESIVEIRQHLFSSKNIRFTINPQQLNRPELPMLLLFGANIMLLAQRHAAAH